LNVKQNQKNTSPNISVTAVSFLAHMLKMADGLLSYPENTPTQKRYSLRSSKMAAKTLA
jgi:hypothetical protein